jgi:hypothetical protein
MYAVTVKEFGLENDLPLLMLDLIITMKLSELDVLCREGDYDICPYDLFCLPEDTKILNEALEVLAGDSAFFTLSCQGKALIVPFEGNQFNIIVGSGVSLPEIKGLHLDDVTDVLNQYYDAYEGYGLAATFG